MVKKDTGQITDQTHRDEVKDKIPSKGPCDCNCVEVPFSYRWWISIF